MDIGLELKNIIDKKEGNKELALFFNTGIWCFSLGNPTKSVCLGEIPGELETHGHTLEEAIIAMKAKVA